MAMIGGQQTVTQRINLARGLTSLISDTNMSMYSSNTTDGDIATCDTFDWNSTLTWSVNLSTSHTINAVTIASNHILKDVVITVSNIHGSCIDNATIRNSSMQFVCSHPTRGISAQIQFLDAEYLEICEIGLFEIRHSGCRVANCIGCTVNSSRCDLDNCMPGYHLEADGGQCTPCLQANCAQCVRDIAVCDRCHDGYFYDSDGSCTRCRVTNCSRCMVNSSRCDARYCMLGYHYEDDSGHCIQCLQANCAQCVDDGTVCDRCHDGYFYDNNGSCTACPLNCRHCTAVDKCSHDGCMPGYRRQSSHLCEACAVAHCRTCTDDVNTCMPRGCQLQYRLTRGNTRCSVCIIANCGRCDLDVTQCEVGGCLPGYTLKQSSCIACGSNCLRCHSMTLVCEEGGCADNYLRGPDGVCRLQSCPRGYGPNFENTDCVACIANCERCNIDPASCDPGRCTTIYQRMDTGACMHFEDCPTHCLSCQLNVSLCDSGQCENGYIRDPSGNCVEEVVCPAHCLSCEHNKTSCDIGYCEEGYEVDMETGLCVSVGSMDGLLAFGFVAIPIIVVPIAIAISVAKHKRNIKQPSAVVVVPDIIKSSPSHQGSSLQLVIKRLSITNAPDPLSRPSSSSSSSSSTLHDPHWQDLREEEMDINPFATPHSSLLSLSARAHDEEDLLMEHISRQRFGSAYSSQMHPMLNDIMEVNNHERLPNEVPPNVSSINVAPRYSLQDATTVAKLYSDTNIAMWGLLESRLGQKDDSSKKKTTITAERRPSETAISTNVTADEFYSETIPSETDVAVNR